MLIVENNSNSKIHIFTNKISNPKIIQLDGENVLNIANGNFEILKNPLISDDTIINKANKYSAYDFTKIFNPSLDKFILDFISDDIPSNYKAGDILYNLDTRELKIYDNNTSINFENGVYGYFFNLGKVYAPTTIKDYMQNIIFPLLNTDNYYGKASLDSIYTANDRSNNPVSSNQEQYFSIFPVFIYAPQDGIYSFGCDGDDAIFFKLNYSNQYSLFLNDHGKVGAPQGIFQVQLTQGYYFGYMIQEERGSADNYYLYWKRPGATDFEIIPNENLFRTDWLKLDTTKLISTFA